MPKVVVIAAKSPDSISGTGGTAIGSEVHRCVPTIFLLMGSNFQRKGLYVASEGGLVPSDAI